MMMTKMLIDSTEDVFYRIFPCGVVKYCVKRDEGCTYITSTRETRNCAAHPDPVHSATKIPSKVDSDIRQAVQENPLLKTKDIMTGN